MKFVKLIFCICFVFSLTTVVFAANYTVTKIADTSDGMCSADCSLREAVAAANATADNDFIYFASPEFAQPQTITLTGGELVVANNGSLTIYGTGANRLTISGNNASRILVSGANVVVNIHHLRFTGGNGVGTTNTGRGGAIYNVGGTMLISHCILIGNSAANGGAINNAASTGPAVNANLTIADSHILNNTATGAGGAMQNFSTSTMTIRNTTISGNTCNSNLTGGGGIQANGMLNMANVTFSGNTAANTGDGGAMFYNGTGLTMNNVTIAGNTGTGTGAGGLHKSIATNNANVRNTIIAGNTGGASPDTTNVFNSLGNNIIGAVGTSTGWVGSDLQNTNPMLAPLGFYGGIGFTHALLTVSPAINGGQNCVTNASCAANNPPVAIPKDERGAPRAGNVDIGAFEANSAHTARLPSALIVLGYNQVLAPNVGAFTYSQNGGTLPTSITVNTSGVTAQVSGGGGADIGTFDFSVLIADTMNSTTQAYRLSSTSNRAFVTVTGRVTDASGNGVSKTTVVYTDQNGSVRTALTNGFGYFLISNFPIGTYTVNVASKQHTFTPQVVTIVDYIDDAEFVVALS